MVLTIRCELVSGWLLKVELVNVHKSFIVGQNFIMWKNSYYQTYYGPILRFLVTFYSVYEAKCDQKAEYETIKSSLIRNCPLYNNSRGLEYSMHEVIHFKRYFLDWLISFFSDSLHQNLTVSKSYL